jgi:C-terminal processing protease CtpA/Prc
MRYQGSLWIRSVLLVLVIAALGVAIVGAQDEPAPADIVNDEGGPVSITGSVEYTNPFFTAGVAQPLVILEDQAGFVDRNKGYLMPPESQTLGQITSDFYTSPFTYSIALPIEPQGAYRDVDQDADEEAGVQVFAIAYWTNTFGEPFLEERDLYGGGWSTAYASTRTSEDAETRDEIIGGKFLIYAPDDQQGFPSSFGEDNLLFTEDDPIVIVPAGYTIVDMDTDPFTFDRSRSAVVDLIEPAGAALADFSGMSYTEAFDAMIAKLRLEYAFSEYKNIDWDALIAQFRPRFAQAEKNSDVDAYAFALRDFTWSIPDGHVAAYPGTAALDNEFLTETAGGLGMAIRDVDDGRTIVNFVLPGGPAEAAGIQLGAEISELNGEPIDDVINASVPYSSPFSTDHTRRLQQLRYAIRFPLGTGVDVTFANPGDAEPTTVTVEAVDERASFAFSSFAAGLTGFELPADYRLHESGYGYARIYSFSDNDLLTIQVWERMIQTLNDYGIPGLIIDMRQNGGGSGFLADQMAAYFFNEPLVLGNSGIYDESIGDFFFDERTIDRFYLPPEELRYNGEVAVLVGPNCNSACEFFAYDMSVEGRAAIVGQYPTGGLGGGVEDFAMPEGQYVRFTVARAVDADGNIHIEGVGVPPTVQVPVTEATLFSGGDPILEAAIEHLNSLTGMSGGVVEVELVEGGDIVVGDSVTAVIEPGQRVRYLLAADTDVEVDIAVGDDAGILDTYLRIYDADEMLIGENDDVVLGEVINSELSDLALESGDMIIIEIGTYADSDAGEFTLQVVESAP